ncbi:hypothetical protein PBI_TEAMOCIL_2 [Microbacterium phage Teamocil]|uniref:Uncharacterized protein n=1 Tax=Microbacterium phage Teamocil TaxID=2656554 RepID=A0A649VXK9_9CAUD|nr:hypothetical protein QDA12_gp02 [Microbacterium phage Teamocil]QGJ88857.1 hypothetical protein PBI_GINA_2 [Microbacterium phage Gina]QGJ96954.1 hypothetical protein PBI_TEAMOCIL_2 [Microbacterium phage Teamocil]
MRLWWGRARHAWTVGLDGPWWERVLVRCLYTVGALHSPTFPWSRYYPRDHR